MRERKTVDVLRPTRDLLALPRGALLDTAVTVQYDSARMPGKQLDIDLPDEPFSLKQQNQSRMNGGLEDDGVTQRDYVQVAPPLVQPHLATGVDAESLLGDLFQVCKDLTVRNSELERLRQSKAYVQPKRRYLGENPDSGEKFYAYDNPLDEVLEAMFATQPETFQDAKSFADKVRRGNFRTDEASIPIC